MANTVPVNTTCYVLRSCTTGDDTVLITSVTVSALSAYVGQHIQVVGYPNICFSVELTESGCADCSKSDSILPITPNPICSCNTLIRYFRLEPCNELLPTFYTQQNLYPYDGTTITFFGQGGVCYNVVGVTGGLLPTNISAITVDCPEPCNCSSQPDAWEITFCDSTGLDPIITSTNLDQYIGAVNTAVFTITYTDGEDTISGCGSVTKTLSQVAPAFTGTFSAVFYDCCEKCTQVCYLLEDCQGAVDPIITCTDLSNYVNNVVKLSNCGDICWKVTTSETCTDSILLGEVLENYPATYTTSPICTYAIPDLVKPPISYFININGIPYQFTYTTNSQVIIDLNSLNLGEFSAASNLLAVIGENNYGNLCYRFSLDSQICIPPVCSTYETNCEYINIPQSIGSLIVFITINGTLYTTTLTGFGIGKLLTWLNSLNLGIFTSNCISLICSINVYGNEIYENIVIGTGVESDTYIPSCNNVIDFDAACEECLPPAPEPPPLVLHIRRIKPGYFSTNSCITTEYMERVNCNFAKQVYDAMLIKRYGITVCCDHDVDAWDIKKQGLDFELLTDPDLCKSTLCYCPAPCLVDVVLTLLPTCVSPILIEATLDNLCFPPTFTDAVVTLQPEPVPCNCYTLTGSNYTIGWIDCCCEYQSANFLTNATVCAHYLPIILEGSVTITAAQECGSELCVALPPTCFCWSITPGLGGEQITYTGCNDIEVMIRASSGDIVSVCSETAPTVINGSAVTNIGFCTTDCGLTSSCVCYQIVITSNDANPATVNMVTTSCAEPLVPITTTIISGTPTLLCSGKVPTVASASPNAVISLVVKSSTACVDCHIPIPCVCYQVLMPALGGVISYIPCGSTTGFANVTVGAGWSYHCSESGAPFSISGGVPLEIKTVSNNCDLGECVSTSPCGIPSLGCWEIVNTGGPAIVLFSDCFAGYALYNMIGTIKVCNYTYLAPPFTGSGTVTLLGPCEINCNAEPSNCQCYRIVMPNLTPATFSYIDCTGITATTVITGTGTICAKTLPKVTSAIVGQIDITYSTDDCALGACI